MTADQARLRQLLLLESILAVGGIVLASIFYLYSITRQQAVAEQLFRHPFAVTQASTGFRGDVIDLRREMLEIAVAPGVVSEERWRQIAVIEARLDRNFSILQRDFLGEPAHLQVMAEELSAWRGQREQIRAAIASGDSVQARALVIDVGKNHVDHLLQETGYVIDFARQRAQQFVDEGQTQLQQARRVALSLAATLLLVFSLVAFKLRAAVYGIFERVEHDALFDSLSGALNRVAVIRQGETEFHRARRHGFPLSLLMFDLDHFKSVNDNYGHAVGDAVLRQFAEICKRHLREGDALGRIGGEEFVILLPYADCEGAREVAERVRQEVHAAALVIEHGTTLSVTTSVGVACSDERADCFADLLRLADEALYRSKQEGRNRVCVSGSVAIP